jgi:hypothetical protein
MPLHLPFCSCLMDVNVHPCFHTTSSPVQDDAIARSSPVGTSSTRKAVQNAYRSVYRGRVPLYAQVNESKPRAGCWLFTFTFIHPVVLLWHKVTDELQPLTKLSCATFCIPFINFWLLYINCDWNVDWYPSRRIPGFSSRYITGSCKKKWIMCCGGTCYEPVIRSLFEHDDPFLALKNFAALPPPPIADIVLWATLAQKMIEWEDCCGLDVRCEWVHILFITTTNIWNIPGSWRRG